MRDRRWVGPATVTALYVAIVVWAAAYHEPWRDEVVPLSIARSARSLTELAEPLRFESHPILWYLLLWVSFNLVGKTWVLKAASLGSASGAIFLFNCSPLPWWLRCLFTFSYFPLYQYSVISRGYSLEMLVLFAFCALYPKRRERPLTLALVLAALANTEAFGFIIALAAGTLLLAEGVTSASGQRRGFFDRWVTCAVVVYLSGLALATAAAFPDPAHRGIGIRQLDLWSIAVGIERAIAQPVAHSAAVIIVPMPSLWVWGYFAYLTRRPPLLCFAAVALIGIEVLLNLVPHLGAAWHIGHVVLVLIATMWLDASASIATYALPARLEHARVWLGRLLAVGVTIALAAHVQAAARDLRADFQYDYSSNQRLAALLRSTPALSNAVVMGEPDTPITSLPYYADNRIYLAREGVFRAWDTFAPPRRFTYDLGALLDAAREVHEQCGCPVVITMGWEIGAPRTYTKFSGTRFEETFVITAEARDQFLAATRQIARLRGPTITDENYDVYLLR